MIELLDEPTVDGYGVVTIGRWGGWLVQIMPMLFNDRLVLTPTRAEGVRDFRADIDAACAFYDYGWCYPKGAAAHIAALAWEPATEAEPPGYIKAVGVYTRKAGERAGGGS